MHDLEVEASEIDNDQRVHQRYISEHPDDFNYIETSKLNIKQRKLDNVTKRIIACFGDGLSKSFCSQYLTDTIERLEFLYINGDRLVLENVRIDYDASDSKTIVLVDSELNQYSLNCDNVISIKSK